MLERWQKKTRSGKESRAYVPLLITDGMQVLVIRNAVQVRQRGEGESRSSLAAVKVCFIFVHAGLCIFVYFACTN